MTIDDLLNTEAIRQALALYARGIDRQDVGLVLEAYWPDGWDAHGSHEGTPAEFAAFVQRNWPKIHMQHIFGQSRIELLGNFAHVESHFTAHHRVIGAGQEYLLGGRYNDRFENRDGVWKVLKRVVVFDWRREWETSSLDAERMAGLPAVNRGSIDEDYSLQFFRE